MSLINFVKNHYEYMTIQTNISYKKLFDDTKAIDVTLSNDEFQELQNNGKLASYLEVCGMNASRYYSVTRTAGLVTIRGQLNNKPSHGNTGIQYIKIPEKDLKVPPPNQFGDEQKNIYQELAEEMSKIAEKQLKQQEHKFLDDYKQQDLSKQYPPFGQNQNPSQNPSQNQNQPPKSMPLKIINDIEIE